MTPRQMYDKALQHENRYLLPMRYGRDPEKDALYATADWLVNNGYARFISAMSDFAPGIQLTGKPYDLQ